MRSYNGVPDGATAPPRNGGAITPDDDNDLALTTRAINVEVTGNVRVTTLGTQEDPGDTITLHIAAGMAFPIRAVRVHATGTTATGIVGLY